MASVVFNYPQIANLRFRTYCNIFWMNFWASNNRLHLDPLTPYLSPKYFNEYTNMWEHPWNIMFLISENVKVWKFGKLYVMMFYERCYYYVLYILLFYLCLCSLSLFCICCDCYCHFSISLIFNVVEFPKTT